MDKHRTDGARGRIADDTQMIFMGRTIERLYGADALDAMVEYTRNRCKRQWQEKAGECGRRDPGCLKCLFSSDAHEYEIIRDEPDCLEVKVTKCVHAEVFQSYNAADLGEKLICSGDHAVVAGFNPNMELVRPTTCMTGDCCHFIFRLKHSSKQNHAQKDVAAPGKARRSRK